MRLNPRIKLALWVGVNVEYRAIEQVGVSLGAYYAKQGFKWLSIQTETQKDG